MSKENVKLFLLGALVALLAVIAFKADGKSSGDMLFAADASASSGVIVLTMVVTTVIWLLLTQ